MRKKDLLGKRFGKLVVIAPAKSENGKTRWLCKCDCGNEKIIITQVLGKNTNSCGCLQQQNRKEIHITHNMTGTRIYNIYRGIKQRCYNTNNQRYNYYGARGIKMCDEWKNDFMVFYNWSMQNNYNDDLSIDRINVDGDYEPNNCRWVNIKKQANNRSTNRYIAYNNETHTLKEWSEILNISYYVLNNRINRDNWSVQKAFTTPINR